VQLGNYEIKFKFSPTTFTFFTIENSIYNSLTEEQRATHDRITEEANATFDAAIKTIRDFNLPATEQQLPIENEEKGAFISYASMSKGLLAMSLVNLQRQLIRDARNYRSPAKRALNIAQSTETLARALASHTDADAKFAAVTTFINDVSPSCETNRILSAAVGAVVEAAFYFCMASLLALCISTLFAFTIPLVPFVLLLVAGAGFGTVEGTLDGLDIFDRITDKPYKMSVARSANTFIEETTTPRPS
jgi:hypothetical protein